MKRTHKVVWSVNVAGCCWAGAWFILRVIELLTA
jgi:hypothetical protein